MDTDKTFLSKLESQKIIKIAGEDKRKFLQGQLTNDVDKINDTSASLSAYCNPQGKVINIFDLFTNNQDLFLVLTKEMQEKTIETLEKYAIFSKVSFDVMNDYSVLIIYGINSASIIADTFNLSPPSQAYGMINKEKVSVIKMATNTIAFKVILPKSDLPEVYNKLSNTVIVPEKSWQELLITEKIVQLSINSSELFLPSELELEKQSAISFDKGCYVGQEIIARMKYLGKSKKELLQIKIEPEGGESIKPAQKIHNQDQQVVGEIASLLRIGSNKVIALAVINKNKKETKGWHVNNIKVSIY